MPRVKTGQAFTQIPQPVQSSMLISGGLFNLLIVDSNKKSN